MLSLRDLPFRNLRFHWRGNLAVLLGVAIGAAVLTGSLFVGDSLRGSLRARAEKQLVGFSSTWTGNRLIRDAIAQEIDPEAVPVLMVQGTITAEVEESARRVTRVTVLGLNDSGLSQFRIVPPAEWQSDRPQAILNAATARELNVKAGDTLTLSLAKFSSVPRSSLLGRRNADDVTTSLRVEVVDVLGEDHAASDFALIPNPAAPHNVFLPLEYLQTRLQQPGKINALFSTRQDTDALNEKLSQALTLADVGLRVVVPKARTAYVSVESEQLVIDPVLVPAITRASEGLGLTHQETSVYLANWISHGNRKIPYSIVAGLNPSARAPLGQFLPEGVTALAENDIVLTDWPESPLKDVPIGEAIDLTFFKPELETGVEETTVTFRLAGRIPLAGPAADPDLTPPFPGITDKLRIGDWDPPFPFDNTRIKPGDANEKYWDKHKTTPKAYISLQAAEKIFESRFGTITSIRVAPAPGKSPEETAEMLRDALPRTLDARALGITWEPTREHLLAASQGSNDFAMLFLAFSCFLIGAALLLVGLLFRLNTERRARELGLFLAVGYTPGTVRRIVLIEGVVIALVGASLGQLLAVGFSRFLLRLLVWLWPDPSVKTLLSPHETVLSIAIGLSATVLLALAVLVYAVWGFAKLSPPGLLRGVVAPPETPARNRRSSWWGWFAAVGAGVLGVAALVAGTSIRNADYRAMSFFFGGGLLLASGILLIRRWLGADTPSTLPRRGVIGLALLGRKNARRFPGRSLLTVVLLASATFLLVAVESFRRSPDQDFGARTGGSGGFNILAEVDAPIFQPIDKGPGLDDLLDSLQTYYQQRGEGGVTIAQKLEADEQTLKKAKAIFSLRIHGGDDASCLNLYKAGQPRVMGIPPALIERGGFRFAETRASTDAERANPWLLLTSTTVDGPIPVIMEQNTAMWMFKKAVGDTIELRSDDGVPVTARIVATLQDSPFQSEVIVSEANFQRLHPREEGYRLILVETLPEDETPVRQLLETGLQRYGLITTLSRDRVAGFQAVVSSYLTTFQLLGVLGLILGIFGIAVVILRNVWERRGEFALLRAFGYTPGAIRTLLLGENLLIILLGLGLGIVSAAVSILPHLALGGAVPWSAIVAMSGGVLLLSVLVVVVASASAIRTPVLTALRED